MTLLFQLLLFVVHELHHDLVNDILDLIMSSTTWTVVTISSDQALRVGTRSKYEKKGAMDHLTKSLLGHISLINFCQSLP